MRAAAARAVPTATIRSATAALVVVATAIGLRTASPADALDLDGVAIPMPLIAVDSQDSVTVVGSSPSLQAVIAELCDQSGVELRSFRAADRDVTARYEEVPLRRALEGLLRHESFVLGFGDAGEDGRARIAWLQVIGTEADTAAVRSASRPDDGSGPAFSLPRVGYSSSDAATRRRTAEALARRLEESDVQRERYLKASDVSYVAQLRGKPHARQFLNELVSSLEDPDLRDKTLAVIRRLR